MPMNLLGGAVGTLMEAQRQQDMLQQQYHQAQNQALLGNVGLGNLLYPNIPRKVRTISIHREEGDIFFAIPSVAYLVEKIPATKILIKPHAYLVTYLAEAKALGLSLKKQCEDLGIPWTARLLTATECTMDSVKLASVLPPSIFSQAKPKDGVGLWATRLVGLYEAGASEEVMAWAAWHVLDLVNDDLDYLKTIHKIAPSTKVATIKERSTEWHRNIWRRERLASIGAHEGSKAKLPEHLSSEPIEYCGHVFALLTTPDDFYDEGKEMRHCIATRFAYAQNGQRCYASVSKDGKRLATAEYDSRSGALLEIKAFANASPDSATRAAADLFGSVIRGREHLAAPKTEADHQVSKASTKSLAQRIASAFVPRTEFDSKGWTG